MASPYATMPHFPGIVDKCSGLSAVQCRQKSGCFYNGQRCVSLGLGAQQGSSAGQGQSGNTSGGTKCVTKQDCANRHGIGRPLDGVETCFVKGADGQYHSVGALCKESDGGQCRSTMGWADCERAGGTFRAGSQGSFCICPKNGGQQHGGGTGQASGQQQGAGIGQGQQQRCKSDADCSGGYTCIKGVGRQTGNCGATGGGGTGQAGGQQQGGGGSSGNCDQSSKPACTPGFSGSKRQAVCMGGRWVCQDVAGGQQQGGGTGQTGGQQQGGGTGQTGGQQQGGGIGQTGGGGATGKCAGSRFNPCSKQVTKTPCSEDSDCPTPPGGKKGICCKEPPYGGGGGGQTGGQQQGGGTGQTGGQQQRGGTGQTGGQQQGGGQTSSSDECPIAIAYRCRKYGLVCEKVKGEWKCMNPRTGGQQQGGGGGCGNPNRSCCDTCPDGWERAGQEFDWCVKRIPEQPPNNRGKNGRQIPIRACGKRTSGGGNGGGQTGGQNCGGVGQRPCKPGESGGGQTKQQGLGNVTGGGTGGGGGGDGSCNIYMGRDECKRAGGSVIGSAHPGLGGSREASCSCPHSSGGGAGGGGGGFNKAPTYNQKLGAVIGGGWQGQNAPTKSQPKVIGGNFGKLLGKPSAWYL